MDMEATNDLLNHVIGQLNLLHHTIWALGQYMMFISVCVALLAALMMFLVGYLLVKGR